VVVPTALYGLGTKLGIRDLPCQPRRLGGLVPPHRESIEDTELDRLCALHRDLGVPDSGHIIRPIVRRGVPRYTVWVSTPRSLISQPS